MGQGCTHHGTSHGTQPSSQLRDPGHHFGGAVSSGFDAPARYAGRAVHTWIGFATGQWIVVLADNDAERSAGSNSARFVGGEMADAFGSQQELSRSMRLHRYLPSAI